jgi:hypothetical protein
MDERERQKAREVSDAFDNPSYITKYQVKRLKKVTRNLV